MWQPTIRLTLGMLAAATYVARLALDTLMAAHFDALTADQFDTLKV